MLMESETCDHAAGEASTATARASGVSLNFMEWISMGCVNGMPEASLPVVKRP
jgi:hypothetical protein